MTKVVTLDNISFLQLSGIPMSADHDGKFNAAPFMANFIFSKRKVFDIKKRGKARIFLKGFRAIGYHPQALNDNQEIENKYGTN